ncbi:hypothetical protein [Thermomonospora umbrina]|uniref:Uncharacterized protein n=1 Tax=Thermomonospora umbrina TaxID=111806 RepID=A0A3D9SM91_9ACTN|nr:hypothetical protein [Thermomonospora umbrina]REE95043.1 hypothetical protein DFJ69_0418 [Thermomonospora umbrina]
MKMVDVPGPEPAWEAAACYQGGKRNPALQYSLWQCAIAQYRPIAGLAAPLEALAARLRLHIEHRGDDPGPVDAAFFRIKKTDFALSHTGDPQVPTLVWLDHSARDADQALDILLQALGLGSDAIDFRHNESPRRGRQRRLER